jgi:hypothetical protein
MPQAWVIDRYSGSEGLRLGEFEQGIQWAPLDDAVDCAQVTWDA